MAGAAAKRNSRARQNSVDRAGEELLIAVHARDVAGLRSALRSGASVERENGAGYTAAMIAVSIGSVDCLAELLDAGADVSQTEERGWSVAMLAAVAGDAGCMELALERGADIEQADAFGNTAAILAAYYGSRECLEMLIGRGADVVEARDSGGLDCLMCVAKMGRLECLGSLFCAGARVGRLDLNGENALDLAEAMGQMDAVRILRALTERAVLSGSGLVAKATSGAKARL